MAALQLREDAMTGRLVLQPTWWSRVSGLGFSLIWLVGIGIFLVPMFFEKEPDWVLVIFLVVVVFASVGASLLNAIFTTTVTIDRGTRTLSSVRSLFFIPLFPTTMTFNDLAKIELQSVNRESLNAWLVSAVSRDGKRIRLNWDGTQREMTALAEKISALTGAPTALTEYALPVALQDLLRKIAPTTFDQAQPTNGAPAAPPPVASPRSGAPRKLPEPQPETLAPAAPATQVAAARAADVWNLTVNQLEQRVANDPRDADACYALARKYHARADLARALESYRAALRVDPSNSQARNDLGVALHVRGKPAEAEAEYRRAVALDPFDSTARLNLALLLRSQKRASEASQEFSWARRNARDATERNAAEAAASGAKMDPRLSKPF